jgi:hypothetical protein
MRLTRMLVPWCIALVLLVAGTNAGRATGFTCASPGDLQTAINSAQGSGNSLNVAGTCTGGPFSISSNGFTLNAPGGAVINGQINVFAPNVTLSGLTIDGTGVSGGNEGVIAQAGSSVTLSNCTIEKWNDGVDVQLNASAAISGGIIKDNTSSGVFVGTGGGVSIGFVANFAPGQSLPVEITGNGMNGVTVSGSGNALLNALNIHANTDAGAQVSSGGNLSISSGTIANNGGDGIDIEDGSTVVFNTNAFGAASATSITGNGGNGIHMRGGGRLNVDQADIQNNATHGIDASDGVSVAIGGGTIAGNGKAGIKVGTATLKLEGTTISGNAGGPALMLILSSADTQSNTISVPVALGQPAIASYRSAINLDSATVTGPGNSYTLVAATGSTVLLHANSITGSDASHAMLYAIDDSAFESLGGNTIHSSSSGNPVVTVSNASTFHELTGPLAQYPASADSILGAGLVQMQSNIELGTGTTPSSWTGNITVVQNSSVRLDGGLTVTGTVTLSQGSNGFFNRSSGGANNAVTTVTCGGTGSSHVAGATFVTPAVTLAAAGAPGCANF